MHVYLLSKDFFLEDFYYVCKFIIFISKFPKLDVTSNCYSLFSAFVVIALHNSRKTSEYLIGGS